MLVIANLRSRGEPNGIPLSDFPVGTLIQFGVNGTPTNFRIVHHGAPSSMYDVSFNDGVILMMDALYESRQWHTLKMNDYANSAIHTYLNGAFLYLIDAGIRAEIKQVKIPYRPGSGTDLGVSSGASGLSAYVWLASGYEMNWTNSNDAKLPADGATFAYFAGTSPVDAKRIAYLNGTPDYWWLRSPTTYDGASAFRTGVTGELRNNTCNATQGIRPALVLPKNLVVFETPNPDGSYSIVT